MAEWSSALTVAMDTTGDASLLTVEGLLDTTTYLRLRDAIVKAALDEPSAVIVDVNALDIPTDSAWSVFTSARWHVSTWPDIPIMVVCASARRREVARLSLTRYVPLHGSLDAALRGLGGDRRTLRRRARADLPASLAGMRQARALVEDRLAAWSQPALIPAVSVIVNVFVENVLQHTASAPVLTLEFDGATITIAVHDGSPTPAARHEDSYGGGDRVSGLAIVASVCRDWGSAPTSSGKTVWAVVGPENKL